jgi:hypothetical protein
VTHAQQLQDDILGLEAQLHGKQLELAMEQGNRALAQSHMLAMNDAIRAQRALRIQVQEQGGACYFLAAGAVDQVQGRAVA